MSNYLTLPEVLTIHDLSLQIYGGSKGVRDIHAAEAAIFRPQSGYYRDAIEEAAAMTENFLIDHPFVDGNKRTALAVCDVFLTINGYQLEADQNWLHDRIICWITQKENRFATITNDLRKCVHRMVPKREK